MKKREILFVWIMFAFLLGISYSQNTSENLPVLKGPYLGQNLPGTTPVKFPFDFMPDGYRLHSAPAFMPGGKEVYFSAMNFSVRFSEKIFVMKMSNDVWNSPEVASFSGNYFDGSPSISSDGKYLFFSSARTTDQKGMNESGDRNIWFVERIGSEWAPPQPLPFSTRVWENGTSLSKNGYLYFDSKDIFKIRFPQNNGQDAEKLDNAVNSSATEQHPCVAPDERFIIFYSSRPGHYGKGGGDLYISFKKDDGNWAQAINLGETFNQGHLSTSFPRLTPDGKYLFFIKLVSVPWRCEVFWVSVDVLDDLNTRRNKK
jgi:Tol biopolymer transport system component